MLWGVLTLGCLVASASVPVIVRDTVTFHSAGARLVGVLAHPEDTGPWPVVVLLHGSERGRRENRFVTTLRERLLPHAIAVFSFDKRGVGDSEGRYQELPDLHDAAADGLAALRALAARPDVRHDRMGLLGVSQGGWVAPLVATLTDSVAFVVSVSGPGVSPREQGLHQRANELREHGLDEPAIHEVNALRAALFDWWTERGDSTAAADAWRRARARPWFPQVLERDEMFRRLEGHESLPPRRAVPADVVEQLHHALYDPVPVASRVKIPVLHVYGEGDRHVPVRESIAALRAAYARAHVHDVSFHTFRHAGHFLQQLEGSSECLTCRDPSPPPFAYAPGYLDLLRDWIVEQTQGPVVPGGDGMESRSAQRRRVER